MTAGIETEPIQVVLLMGPTGAGKTDLALRLAERLPVEIISVDSAMVYRGMDIGTGKPGPEILQRFPHHLVDILDPREPYSAGQFMRDAHRAILDIHARGRLPLLVGGTMLYFRALRGGLAEMPGADPVIREQLTARARVLGWPALHAELAQVDPRAAARIQPQDAQRIQRALEVFTLTGETLSAKHAAAARSSPAAGPKLSWSACAWLPSDRQQLYANIERRFAAMLRAGLLEEVRALHARGDLHAQLPAVRAVGYRQLWEHLDGKAGHAEAAANAVVATRHLARRQLMWLRADRDKQIFDALETVAVDQIEAHIKTFC
jgi:tRNA dimethylallyltransferase